MLTGRYGYIAVLLPNGKVLVAGGPYLASAEIYDPVTENWLPANPMNTPRYYASATLLANGKMLVAGGYSSGSSEIYDPVAGTCAPTGPLNTPRGGLTAALLPDGKVLTAGGEGLNGLPTNIVALFSPADQMWTAVNSLHTPRNHHTMTLLPNYARPVAGHRHVV